MMTHTTPDSSHIREMRYDEKTSTLYVDFRTGKTYKFLNVPQEVYNGAVIAGSAGKYFSSSIKGKYEFEVVSSAEMRQG